MLLKTSSSVENSILRWHSDAFGLSELLFWGIPVVHAAAEKADRLLISLPGGGDPPPAPNPAQTSPLAAQAHPSTVGRGRHTVTAGSSSVLEVCSQHFSVLIFFFVCKGSLKCRAVRGSEK